MKKPRNGFTLVEILIVITIIAILLILAFMSVQGQMAHATDAKRKTDLYTLSKFFEDYYNDNTAYPVQSAVDNCGGSMAPYITNIPCDPVFKEHYGYFPSVSGGYRICAKLTDKTDPAIAAAGCSGSSGCGLGGPASGGVYNFCQASGVAASAVGTVDEIAGGGGGGGGGGGSTPTPTPTPNLNPANHIACTLGGDCNWYDDPSLHGCPVSWQTTCPGYTTPGTGACAISANLCTD